MDTTLDDNSMSPLTVGSRPLTLNVPVGASIFALRGEAWITQDGLLDDIIVSRGQSFVVRDRGALVVSATRDPTDLMIVRPALARAYPAADTYDFVRAYALQLRRDAIASALSSTIATLRSWLTRARGHVIEYRRIPAQSC